MVRQSFESELNGSVVSLNEVGGEIFHAEHGLVVVEREFLGVSQVVVKDVRPVVGLYLLAVDVQLAEAQAERRGSLVKVALVEHHHSVDAANEYLAVVRHVQSLLVD